MNDRTTGTPYFLLVSSCITHPHDILPSLLILAKILTLALNPTNDLQSSKQWTTSQTGWSQHWTRHEQLWQSQKTTWHIITINGELLHWSLQWAKESFWMLWTLVQPDLWKSHIDTLAHIQSFTLLVHMHITSNCPHWCHKSTQSSTSSNSCQRHQTWLKVESWGRLHHWTS